MNLLEELRSLDPRDPGRWPLVVRAGAVAVAFVALSALLTYFLVWQDKSAELQRHQDVENGLRGEFKTKHAKAVNLEVYKQQLKDIERSFGALLRQLPGKTEVPNLLVDISQTGLAAGLSEKLFQPQPEVKPYERFIYSVADRRSPFTPSSPSGGPGSLRPDAKRNREFLEQFPLDTLKMVGTLRLADRMFALVQTKDGLVHRVSSGNYLGQADGKITEISSAKISLTEIVPDGVGGYMERPAQIALNQ